MEESILVTIKKMLGLGEEYTPFDMDIIVHINTYIRVLNQLGVGKDGFFIEDKSATWSDLLEGTQALYQDVKTYLYLRVRLVFDPPTSSILASAINDNVAELSWRLHEQAEYEEATST